MEGFVSAIIGVLISDKPQAGALAYAQEYQIPTYVVSPAEFTGSSDFGLKLLQILTQHEIDWVVLAGYLRKIPDNVVAQYENRIVNIHPALLPAFGGKGMYGMNVHRAVYLSGVHYSGVTVHLVNNEYDAGPIVAQKAVYIADCRSPEEIAERVLVEEHQLYPAAVKKLIENRFTLDGKRIIWEDVNT
jgi:phosphoribosylglycinamide formyltransferase-1